MKLIFALSLLSTSFTLLCLQPSSHPSQVALTYNQLLTKDHRLIAQTNALKQTLSLVRSHKITSVEDLCEDSLLLFKDCSFEDLQSLISQLSEHSLMLTNRQENDSETRRLFAGQQMQIQTLLKDLILLNQIDNILANYKALLSIKQDLEHRYAKELAYKNHPYFKKLILEMAHSSSVYEDKVKRDIESLASAITTNPDYYTLVNDSKKVRDTLQEILETSSTRGNTKLLIAGLVGVTGIALYGIIKAYGMYKAVDESRSINEALSSGEELKHTYESYDNLRHLLLRYSISSSNLPSSEALRDLSTEGKMITIPGFVSLLKNHSESLSQHISSLAKKSDPEAPHISEKLEAQLRIITNYRTQLELLPELYYTHQNYFNLRYQYGKEREVWDTIQTESLRGQAFRNCIVVTAKNRYQYYPFLQYSCTIKKEIDALTQEMNTTRYDLRNCYKELYEQLTFISHILEQCPELTEEKKEAGERSRTNSQSNLYISS